MIKQILIILIFTSSFLLAQNISKISDRTPVLELPHGYVIESISGIGFRSSINNKIANINSSNPASINNFQKLSFGLSYQFESTEQPGWIADIGRSREQNYYPQSFGLIVPVKMFRVGLGYSQRYNSVLDFGEIEKCTPEQPDGTGEFFSASKAEVLYCYSVLLAYSINDFINKGNILSIGLNGCFNNLNLKEKIFNDRINEDFNEISWTIGIQYNDENKFYIGLSYLKSPFFRNSFMYEDVEIKIEDKMPDKLYFGILYRFNSYLNISLDLVNVYWHQQSDGLFNSVDISSSIQTNITKQVSFSLGFLSTEYYRNDWEINQYLYGLYLLGGLNLRFQHYDFDLAYVTSTNSSGDWRKQKIGKITIGFYL